MCDCRKFYWRRVFSVAVPSLWNCVPGGLCGLLPSSLSFCHSLKIIYFAMIFMLRLVWMVYSLLGCSIMQSLCFSLLLFVVLCVLNYVVHLHRLLWEWDRLQFFKVILPSLAVQWFIMPIVQCMVFSTIWWMVLFFSAIEILLSRTLYTNSWGETYWKV